MASSSSVVYRIYRVLKEESKSNMLCVDVVPTVHFVTAFSSERQAEEFPERDFEPVLRKELGCEVREGSVECVGKPVGVPEVVHLEVDVEGLIKTRTPLSAEFKMEPRPRDVVDAEVEDVRRQVFVANRRKREVETELSCNPDFIRSLLLDTLGLPEQVVQELLGKHQLTQVKIDDNERADFEEGGDDKVGWFIKHTIDYTLCLGGDVMVFETYKWTHDKQWSCEYIIVPDDVQSKKNQKKMTWDIVLEEADGNVAVALASMLHQHYAS